MKDGRPFTFTGLWENWKDPESDQWLRTCTIITGEPNELVAQIHPRMPVILPEQHHAAWLGETNDGNLKELLLPLVLPRVSKRLTMGRSAKGEIKHACRLVFLRRVRPHALVALG